MASSFAVPSRRQLSKTPSPAIRATARKEQRMGSWGLEDREIDSICVKAESTQAEPRLDRVGAVAKFHDYSQNRWTTLWIGAFAGGNIAVGMQFEIDAQKIGRLWPQFLTYS
jgi:hypothetical protein